MVGPQEENTRLLKEYKYKVFKCKEAAKFNIHLARYRKGDMKTGAL